VPARYWPHWCHFVERGGFKVDGGLAAASDQKERWQRVLFPRGAEFSDEIYRTARTCLLFNLLGESEGRKNKMATLPGIENGFGF
jgi:hypothetical protein